MTQQEQQQQLPTDEVLRRSLREGICPLCPMRPPGSENLGPLTARTCEPTCTIFTNLEPLKDIALGGAGDPLAAYERRIKEQICQKCMATPTAGDFCYEGFSRTCPLSIMAPTVLLVIEALITERSATGNVATTGDAKTQPRKKTGLQ
jgi:hypothetical protein